MTDKRAEIILLVVIAEAIKDLDDWPRNKPVTSEDFLGRVNDKLEESIRRDLDGFEFLETECRTLYGELLRAYDLLLDPKAPPRGPIN